MRQDFEGSLEDLRRRVAQWRAAERREQALRNAEGPMNPLRNAEGPMNPSAALAAADELYDLCRDLLDRPDPVRARELVEARRAWRLLRSRFGLTSTGRHP